MTNDFFDYGNEVRVAGEDVIDEMAFETDMIRINNGIDDIGEPNGEQAAFQVRRTESTEMSSTTEHTYEVDVGVVTDDGFQEMDTYQFPVSDDYEAPDALRPQEMQDAYGLAGRVMDAFMNKDRSVDTVEGADPEGEYQTELKNYDAGSPEGPGLHFPLDEEEEDDSIDVI